MNDPRFDVVVEGVGRGVNRIAFTVVVILFFSSGVVYALNQGEQQKINFLISSIEYLQGAKFIRNGSEYEAKEAAEHLRMKLQKAGGRVKTANDFIRLCASQSYVTGKPYLIKFPDGKILKSETYLRERLKEFPSNGK